MEIQKFIEREKARAGSFRLLAACFYHPNVQSFREERVLQNLSDALKTFSSSASLEADRLITAFNASTEEELLVDYARLFLGPSEMAAPPYGSVYLDREGRVMGDSTMAVLDCYRCHGLEIDSEFSEVPDHIAVELEFVYYLIFKEIASLEASDTASAAALFEAQNLFLNTFLRKWVGPFSSNITGKAGTEFYRALGACLNTLICETEFGNVLPGALRSAASIK